MTALPVLSPSPVPPGQGAEVTKKAPAAAPAGSARVAADDDDGGFAAALGDARARVDDSETGRTTGQGTPADGIDAADATHAAASGSAEAPRAADLPPAPELAEWLPGWPPAAPAVATSVATDSAAADGTADAAAAAVPTSPAVRITPPIASSATGVATASHGPAAMTHANGDESVVPDAGAITGVETPTVPPRPERQAPTGSRASSLLAQRDAAAMVGLARQTGEAARRTAAASDAAAAVQPSAARAIDAAAGSVPWATLPGLAPRLGHPEGATAAPAVPFEAHLAAALDSPAFAPALATQVKWLLREGVQHAQLSLNPADMGPVTVHIAVDGTQARIDFSADIAVTRSTIETSLPTLAAALHASGLTLAGGGVFDGQPRHGAAPGRSTASGRGRNEAVITAAGAGTAEGAAARRPRGLVDLVA